MLSALRQSCYVRTRWAIRLRPEISPAPGASGQTHCPAYACAPECTGAEQGLARLCCLSRIERGCAASQAGTRSAASPLPSTAGHDHHRLMRIVCSCGKCVDKQQLKNRTVFRTRCSTCLPTTPVRLATSSVRPGGASHPEQMSRIPRCCIPSLVAMPFSCARPKSLLCRTVPKAAACLGRSVRMPGGMKASWSVRSIRSYLRRVSRGHPQLFSQVRKTQSLTPKAARV